MRAVIARVLDGSRLEEFKSNYGKTLITGGWVERGFGAVLSLLGAVLHQSHSVFVSSLPTWLVWVVITTAQPHTRSLETQIHAQMRARDR
jgi:hypothetical protein